MKTRFPRSFYIPGGAIKVADKASTAVAYLYQGRRGPAAVTFHGKADKPDWQFYFSTAAQRENRIKEHFDRIRSLESSRRQRAADRKAYVNEYRVGDVLHTSWGYDQTNVEFFEVTEVKAKQVILREIAAESIDTGFLCGKSVPVLGRYVGEPIRRLAQKGRVKIDEVRTAWPTDFTEGPAGIRVYRSFAFSNTH